LYGDAEEPPVESLEPAFGFLIGELPAVHLEKMACSNQHLANSREAAAGSAVGCGKHRCVVRLSSTLAGSVELAL
jgi:hypothetical protein